MSLPKPPLWCRIILLVLTVGSFLPQILRIQATKTTAGLSPCYILWNLISATEQLTIYIYLIITENEPDGTIFLHCPPTVGDRFSLCHCAVVTILFLTLFTQAVFYSDHRIFLTASYMSFLLISIVPLVIDAISPIDGDARRFLFAVYFAIHCLLLYPIITALGALSICHQARAIWVVPFPNALSLQGLGLQAIVFTLVSVTWIWSLPFPYEQWDGRLNWNIFSTWYGAVGWVIIDGLVFTLGQAILLLLALRRSSSSKVHNERADETDPLLGTSRNW